MTLPNDDIPLPPSMKATARAHWKALLIEGILLTICGLAAVLLPLMVHGPTQIATRGRLKSPPEADEIAT